MNTEFKLSHEPIPGTLRINGMTLEEWNEFVNAEYHTLSINWDIPEEPKPENHE